MARPHDYSQLPTHPAVSQHYKKKTKYGWTTITADVTCPTCGRVRSFPLYTLRQQMQKPHFNGQCIKCGQAASRASTKNTLRKKFAGRSRVATNGYVAIAASAIEDRDLDLFNAMRRKASFIFEHRLAMARFLGRPLHSWECLDHMDGNKQNNDPSNLRIYVKGNNDPGSTCGHGTYYHEWQLALKRIRELEERLKHRAK